MAGLANGHYHCTGYLLTLAVCLPEAFEVIVSASMLKLKLPFQLITVIVLLLLQACATDGEQWNPNDYTVRRGDSIYSIAWHYEIDPITFAHWNHIDRPFLIYPGQRLHIRKPRNFQRQQSGREQQQSVTPALITPENVTKSPLEVGSSKISPSEIRVKPGDTLYALSKNYHLDVAELARLNHLKQPYEIIPGQILRLKPSPGVPSSGHRQRPRPEQRATARSSTPPVVSAQKWPTTIHWRWPVKGKVLRRYQRDKLGARGIDIAGRIGERVNAAAAGKVVYSGNGLISYGNLVIIKHNDHFLSAYAYNHKLLVHEGQWVKAGQQIAEMGRKGDGQPRTHFEIRKNGKPVNPQYYLPR